MDEKDISNALTGLKTPEPTEAEMHRTMNAAWEKRQEHSGKRKFSFYSFPQREIFLALAVFILVGTFSYAVTQSSRSGSGDASGETSLINSAQLSQYPAGVRTSVVRMVISGTKAEALRFNAPDQLAALNKPTMGVFHPQGGGAIYQDSPSDMMDSGQQGKWFYSMALNIENIGTQAADIIAFLPGITETVCRKINHEVGINEIPALTDFSAYYKKQMIDDGKNVFVPLTGPAPVLANAGQPFACVRSGSGGPYVYYHVLIER